MRASIPAWSYLQIRSRTSSNDPKCVSGCSDVRSEHGPGLHLAVRTMADCDGARLNLRFINYGSAMASTIHFHGASRAMVVEEYRRVAKDTLNSTSLLFSSSLRFHGVGLEIRPCGIDMRCTHADDSRWNHRVPGLDSRPGAHGYPRSLILAGLLRAGHEAAISVQGGSCDQGRGVRQ